MRNEPAGKVPDELISGNEKEDTMKGHMNSVKGRESKIINCPGFACVIPADRSDSVTLLMSPALANREYVVTRKEAAKYIREAKAAMAAHAAKRNAEVFGTPF